MMLVKALSLAGWLQACSLLVLPGDQEHLRCWG